VGHIGEYKGMAWKHIPWLDEIHRTDVEILKIREMENGKNVFIFLFKFQLKVQEFFA